MIKIHRVYPGPARLLINGSRQTQRDCAAYEEKPEEYVSGKRHFPPKSYYAWKVVKDVLMRMHHGKCCYCEKQIERGDLHVEHFRPKGAVRQQAEDSRAYPGYYWLAYSWDNLFLACPTCNRIKGDQFPLENPEHRARCHNDDISHEIPMFVNPSVDDPREHIRFKDDAPCPSTDRGRHTIKLLKLDRDELTDLRLTYFKIFENVKSILRYDQGRYRQEAAKELRAAMRESAPFSSMVMDLFEPTDPLLSYVEKSGD